MKHMTSNETMRRIWFVALAAAACLGACDTGDEGTRSESETHFLSTCDGSCAGGLDCICGVCTRTCEGDDSCGSLSAEATCQAARVCDGGPSTCDVDCSEDEDCQSLGSGARCDQGQCRVTGDGSGVESTDGVQSGGTDTEASTDSTTGAATDSSGSTDEGSTDSATDVATDSVETDSASDATDVEPGATDTGGTDVVSTDVAATDALPNDAGADGGMTEPAAGNDAGSSEACSAPLPAGCDCNDDGDCAEGQLCYFADCDAEQPGGCSAPPGGLNCWSDRDCAEGSSCSGGDFPICGRDTVTIVGMCVLDECGDLGTSCDSQELCVRFDGVAGGEPSWQCVSNPCAFDPLSCECAASICEASTNPDCSVASADEANRDADLSCQGSSGSDSCLEQAATGCAPQSGEGAVACCDGLLCCGGVPYDVNGECLPECQLLSDRNLKTNIASIDHEQVLEQLSSLPISSWSYRSSADVRHLGPMAQDFQQAFSVGDDPTRIAPVDAAGVALAAVQALNEKLERLTNENSRLQQQLDRLESRCSTPAQPGSN